MGKPTEYYCDPSVAGNTGSGSSVDPFSNIQFALDNITQGADGDRINVKSGADDVLSSALTLSTYGTPGAGRPLILQGFASTIGDGDLDAGTGIGGIDLDGNTMWVSAAYDYIWHRHLHIHGRGSSTIVDLDNYCMFIECEVEESSGNGLDVDTHGVILGCHLHDIGGYGLRFTNANGARAYYNYLKNDGTNDFNTAIVLGNQYCEAHGNIISIDGSSDGIEQYGVIGVMKNNTVLSNGGSGTGISIVANGDTDNEIWNNYVEGFSGTGGIGIDTSALTGNFMPVLTNNACFNNATNYSTTGEAIGIEDDNETLSSSGLEKSGSDTFANRETYFEPTDEGSMRGGSYPTVLRRDKGAVQHADAASGGGMLVHPGMSGGLRG